ncbi:MAG: hypothetical protein ACSHW0_09075 [Thalassotalea sp.]
MKLLFHLAFINCFTVISIAGLLFARLCLAADANINSAVPQAPITVAYLTSDHSYFPKLLQLALDKSIPAYGPYTLIEKPWLGPKERMRKLLAQQKHIDVIWGTSSPAREQQLTAIKINILKGLNQYRLLLIHPETQAKFDHITSLEQLKSYTGIVGAYWRDTEIMKQNNLPLVTALNYQNTVAMFAKKRADYFPRGIYEVWSELQNAEFSTFVLERNLMLKYSAGYYFFVNEHNLELAKRIESGLKIAQQDGSFDLLYFSYPEFAKGWQEMSNNKRKIIYLP